MLTFSPLSQSRDIPVRGLRIRSLRCYQTIMVLGDHHIERKRTGNGSTWSDRPIRTRSEIALDRPPQFSSLLTLDPRCCSDDRGVLRIYFDSAACNHHRCAAPDIPTRPPTATDTATPSRKTNGITSFRSTSPRNPISQWKGSDYVLLCSKSSGSKEETIRCSERAPSSGM